MKKTLIVLGVFTFIGIIVGSWLGGTYNTLVSQDETVTTAWAQVETQYQRRFDLIPNLVNATKGFLKQEQKVFGDIANARTKYSGSASGSNERVAATSGLDSAMGRLLVIMENYPELKSNETVKALTDELAGTENRISVERNRYNRSVKEMNVLVKRFPTNLLAGMFGFESRLFFESTEGSDVAPTVDLTI